MVERDLAHIFRVYGEERWSSRIAQFIVRERANNPVRTTGQLVEVIKAAIPAAARREDIRDAGFSGSLAHRGQFRTGESEARPRGGY